LANRRIASLLQRGLTNAKVIDAEKGADIRKKIEEAIR
jgi:hypothetical protein